MPVETTRMKRQLFKVQYPLYTSDQKERVLIYNRDRSVMWQAEDPIEVLQLVSAFNLGKRNTKLFTYGEVNEEGKIELEANGVIPMKEWPTW